jgi:choline transport protein
VIALSCLYNVFAARRLTWLNYVAIAMSLTGWLVTIIVQAKLSSTRNSAEYVFTSFLNEMGWDNDGVVWILGLLQSAYALVGYDVVAHLSKLGEKKMAVAW